MKPIIALFFILISASALGQVEDALVFFNDKPDVENQINNPNLMLTERAIARKERHNTPIDFRDVPVDESYITMLKADENGITVFSKSKWLNAVYVRGNLEDIQALETTFDFVTGIEYANKNRNTSRRFQHRKSEFVETTSTRADFDYGEGQNQVEMIQTDKLHDMNLTGEDMVIAMLDSGFPNVETISAFQDAVSEGRFLGNYNFVDRTENVATTSSHGTTTFSDIAAFTEGALVGTAPKASYYLFVTEDVAGENPVEEAYMLEALERADSLGVDVANISLGYQDFQNSTYDHTFEDLNGITTIGARAANFAFDKGMIVVTSAGNDGNGFGTVATPADALNVLAVGAVTASEQYASFSSRGPTVDGRIKPDVMAQGSGAAIIRSDGSVAFSNGTSFSSPIIAGSVASLWQNFPNLTNAQIMQLVRESGSTFNAPTAQMGYGIPDFQVAFNRAETLATEDFFEQDEFTVFPNPVSTKLNVQFPSTVEAAQLSIHNILGQQVLKQIISKTDSTVFTADLSRGIYLVKISAGNSSKTFKILKQ